MTRKYTEEDLASGVYAKRPVEIVSGSGCYIYDNQHNKYIDMGASYGVCNVGHCNPDVVEAVKAQAEKLFYISSTYPNPVRRELMEKIINIAPSGMARTFLCNSGTESIEAAIKFAILHTKKTYITSTMRAYHGRTLGSLSVTWNKKYREPFSEHLMQPVKFVKYDDLEGMKDVVDSNTAAVLLEPIQGEGGVYVPDKDYLKGVREICDDAGALLIVDEIQTGLGRTGKMFCIENYSVTPDILCIGKSLGGGLPIAATVLHAKLGEMPKGMHGSTFGGNPIACVAGCATLDYIQKNDLPHHAAEVGEYFKSRLINIPSTIIREVRGVGLMLAIELKTKNTPYLNLLLNSGIAPLPGGTTNIRFLPPLVVEKEEIDKTINVLEEVLNDQNIQP